MMNTSPFADLERDHAFDRRLRRSPLRAALCFVGATFGWTLAACGFAALAASVYISVAEARVSAAAVSSWHERAAAATADDDGRFTLALADMSAPVVAVVVDDVGLDPAVTDAVLALPASVTVSVLPYAPNSAAVHANARAGGHETFVHLPMEPLGYADPGPAALATWMPAEAIATIAAAAFDAAPGATGFNNHMGSRFTRCADCVDPVLAEARRRGLLAVDSLTDGRSVLAERARAIGVDVLRRDIFVDDGRPSAAVMQARLAEAERLAERRGWAVVIAHPHADTLEALSAWIPQAQARGVHVGTVSDARDRRNAPPRLRA